MGLRVAVATGLTGFVVGAVAPGHAQQEADTSFTPAIPRPTHAAGQGPVVAIDEAHHNFHTAGGRYAPFARLLRRDGYVVRPFAAGFVPESLATVDVLVIANALAERNAQDWSLPTPSAFTPVEIAAVEKWVAGGGRLLLIADHMPMAGAAQALGGAFGVEWSNGFATDERERGKPMAFRRADGTLVEHAIARGRDTTERVTRVLTFTGSAFRGDRRLEPLLRLRKGVVSLEPQVAWEFGPRTPRVEVGGWLQGAVLRHGRGRVALFGEAAMFTAQIAGPERRKVGMNVPEASENARFLLNVMRWLAAEREG